MVAATIPIALRKPASADWLNTYVFAAQQMVAHQPIHTAGKNALGFGPFTYPPAAALLAVPLVSAPPMLALLVWYAASVVACCVAVLCAWRLAAGPPLATSSRRWIVILGLGLFLGARYLISPFGNRQTDMLVAAAVLGGCWLLVEGREIRGAICLGLAAAIKSTPLLFAPYLIWRGRWLAASALVVVAVATNLLPDLLWPRDQSYLVDWGKISLAPVRDGTSGQWFVDPLRNQSIAGVVGRFSAFGFITSPEQIAAEQPAISVERIRATKIFAYGCGILLLALTAFRFGRRKPDRFQSAIEFAAVLCLMLLLSPMTSKSHLCVLILPLFLIARTIVERRTPGWIAFGVLLTLLGPLASRDVIGRNFGDLTLAWGLPALFIFLNLVAMWKLGRETSPVQGVRLPSEVA